MQPDNMGDVLRNGALLDQELTAARATAVALSNAVESGEEISHLTLLAKTDALVSLITHALNWSGLMQEAYRREWARRDEPKG